LVSRSIAATLKLPTCCYATLKAVKGYLGTRSPVATSQYQAGAGAILSRRWMSAVNFRTVPRGPLRLLAGAVLAPLAALVGCWRPARRAGDIERSDLIREE